VAPTGRRPVFPAISYSRGWVINQAKARNASFSRRPRFVARPRPSSRPSAAPAGSSGISIFYGHTSELRSTEAEAKGRPGSVRDPMNCGVMMRRWAPSRPRKTVAADLACRPRQAFKQAPQRCDRATGACRGRASSRCAAVIEQHHVDSSGPSISPLRREPLRKDV